MKRTFKSLLTFMMVVLSAMAVFAFSSSAAEEKDNWICAWGTAPTQIGIDGYSNISAYVGDVTVRTVIKPTATGSKIRIKLSNVYGREPLVLTRVTVATSVGGSKIIPESTKIITFNDGYQYVTLAPGEEIYSDPVSFPVKAIEDEIAISMYAEKFTEITTMGLSGAQSYLTFGGDKTDDETFSLASVLDNEQILQVLNKMLGLDFDLQLGYSFINVVPCIASLDVLSETNNGYSVVVIGDSTVANEFPLHLAEAINAKGITNVGVVGKGIIGNRLLGDGLGLGSQIFGKSLLERFDTDALRQSGVKYVVIKIGANDIIHPVCTDIIEEYKDKGGIEQPTAQDIINGYKQLFKKCHDAGVKVIAVSITQWKGSTRNYFGSGDKYVRTEEEFKKDWKIAQTVNKWLKDTSEHDGYVDFVTLSSNPMDPDAFYPEYTIDGIHPSDTLQKIWGESFPLSLVGIGKSVNKVTVTPAAMAVYAGYTRKLTAKVYPTEAEDKSVKWYSSDPKIATVSATGVVKGISNGYCTITCKSNDGGIIDTAAVRVVTRVESVSLNKTSVKLYTTKSTTLKPIILPAAASNKNVTWKSSNTKVATVDKNGKVTAVGSGKATITCTTENRGLTAKCVVTVLKKVEVASLTLNKYSQNMYKGRTVTLKAIVGPADATFKQVKWTSSNTKVATVDKNGVVTAVGRGTATITCTSTDNPMIKRTCEVKVYVRTTGVKLNTTGIKVYETKTRQLTATVTPSDATNKNVTWKSSDRNIATVNSKGLVTAKKPGTAYITCTTNNGGYVAKCKVVVVKLVKSTSVTLNKTSVSIYDGNYYQLTATVKPADTSSKAVTYTSSDTSVVKVYSSGKIYGVKPGKATITCKTKDTGKTAKCVVTVKAVVPTKVTLNKTSVSVGYNKTYQLKATVSPSNATNKAVTWKSSDSSVVYVNSNGVVKGLKPGKSATITCTTVSGKVVAKCTVKVNPVKVTGVKLNKTAAKLAVGEKVVLTATIAPVNATNKAVTWTTSNAKVATVNSKGVVTAVSDGKALVGCVTKDGGFVAVCTVEVKTIPVLGVVLNETKLSLKPGATFTLKPTVVPDNASNKNVTWSTSDKSVATVVNGKVTAVGKGTCEIKVHTKDGNYIALCKVTVS